MIPLYGKYQISSILVKKTKKKICSLKKCFLCVKFNVSASIILLIQSSKEPFDENIKGILKLVEVPGVARRVYFKSLFEKKGSVKNVS